MTIKFNYFRPVFFARFLLLQNIIFEYFFPQSIFSFCGYWWILHCYPVAFSHFHDYCWPYFVVSLLNIVFFTKLGWTVCWTREAKKNCKRNRMQIDWWHIINLDAFVKSSSRAVCYTQRTEIENNEMKEQQQQHRHYYHQHQRNWRKSRQRRESESEKNQNGITNNSCYYRLFSRTKSTFEYENSVAF